MFRIKYQAEVKYSYIKNVYNRKEKQYRYAICFKSYHFEK